MIVPVQSRKSAKELLDMFAENRKFRIKKYDYENRMRLGKGSFGVVYKAKKGDRYYAVKFLDGISGDFTAAFQEYSIHAKLKHKNVAQFIEAFQGMELSGVFFVFCFLFFFFFDNVVF
jgi:serine/threonine protein kinase